MRFSLIIILLCLSCNQSRDSRKHFSNPDVKVTNESLKKDSLVIDSIHQRKLYESLISSEINKGPDSIISDYSNFLKSYPKSIWKKEILDRISTIDSIREFWSKKDGWKLLGLKPAKDMENISCPSSFNF